MTVLHLSQTDINSDSRILKELKALRRLGEQLDLDLKLYGLGVKRLIGNIEGEPVENVEVISINLLSKNIKFLPKSFVNIILVFEIFLKMFFTAYKLKPNIIHCHDTPVLPLGAMLKLLIGSQLIYDAHELESNRNDLPRISGIMVLYVEKLLWRFIDALIVVSPSIEKWYKINIGNKKSKVILNSPVLDSKLIKEDKSYLRNHFSIDNKSRIFIYVGFFHKGRGIDILMKIFQRKDIQSHIVFLGYGPLKNHMEKIAKKTKNIHIHDAVSHNKVVAITRSADIGVCFIQNVSLSDYFCLPNKLFEYCFSEIPVLASNFPDIESTVKEYNLGKCSDLNECSIYNSIKDYESIAELPKINVHSLYPLSWGAQETKLLELYISLISKRKKK